MDSDQPSREGLASDSAETADSGQGTWGLVRWRDFTVVRWLGLLGLIMAGGVLFSNMWWLGIVLGIAGLALIEWDNAKRRRLPTSGPEG